jgi:organic hydroperoxide reductase OsmC/OhrA
MNTAISAKILWKKQDNQSFIRGHYSREHIWEFDNGHQINASSSPHIVPIPYSNPAFIDPEEAFICSVSSCHMLFFLSIAAKKKIEVLKYIDTPIGELSKNASNQIAINEITLQPSITFKETISNACIKEIHRIAHENCFIAKSINSKIKIKSL